LEHLLPLDQEEVRQDREVARQDRGEAAWEAAEAVLSLDPVVAVRGVAEAVLSLDPVVVVREVAEVVRNQAQEAEPLTEVCSEELSQVQMGLALEEDLVNAREVER